MKEGKQIEMFFKKEAGRDPLEKAQEYLDNPNYLDIYKDYRERYGAKSRFARGVCETINLEVGFPMAYWDSAHPESINIMDTEQIKSYIENEKVKRSRKVA
jgi:hypothetical protein